jgi:transposase
MDVCVKEPAPLAGHTEKVAGEDIYSLSGDIFIYLNMGYTRTKFKQKGFDQSAYEKYFHGKQAEYIRNKLRSVLLYHQGKEYEQIAVELCIHQQSVRKYVNIYLSGGFEQLCKQVMRPQKSRLTAAQSAAFKQVLLTSRPDQVGLEGNLWTGKLMRQYLKKVYQVDYKSGIYDLLERLSLSHQKSHADYGNAKPDEQIAFIGELKNTILEADEKTALLKFDEFSICEKPSAFYGWAQKNTRPKLVTDEKKEAAPTGC